MESLFVNCMESLEKMKSELSLVNWRCYAEEEGEGTRREQHVQSGRSGEKETTRPHSTS